MPQAGISASRASATIPDTSPMPCRILSKWPTIVPARCVSGCSVVKVIAATMGKKISAPSHTISAR